MLRVLVYLFLFAGSAAAIGLDSLVRGELRGSSSSIFGSTPLQTYEKRSLPLSIQQVFPHGSKAFYQYIGLYRLGPESLLLRFDHQDHNGTETFFILSDSLLKQASLIKCIGTSGTYFKSYDKARTEQAYIDSTQIYVTLKGWDRYSGLKGLFLEVWTNWKPNVWAVRAQTPHWKECYHLSKQGQLRPIDSLEWAIRTFPTIPQQANPRDSIYYFPVEYYSMRRFSAGNLSRYIPSEYLSRDSAVAKLQNTFLITPTLRLLLCRVTYKEYDSTGITDVLITIDSNLDVIDRLIIPSKGAAAVVYNAARKKSVTGDVYINYIYVKHWYSPTMYCYFALDGGWLGPHHDLTGMPIILGSAWREHYHLSKEGKFVKDSLELQEIPKHQDPFEYKQEYRPTITWDQVK